MQIAISPSTYIYVDFPVPTASGRGKYVFVSNCSTVSGTINFDGEVQASVLAQVLYDDENVLGEGVYISDYCD